MIGPYFQRLLDNDQIRLPKGLSMDDLETMYTLLLKARLGSQKPNEDDEHFILILLCRIVWPGKKPNYVSGILAYLSNFRGISKDYNKQARFFARIAQQRLQAYKITRSGEGGQVILLNEVEVQALPSIRTIFKARRPTANQLRRAIDSAI
jgi:hypothetical protein